MTHKVFVYGTLRPSKVATHVLYGFDMYNYGKFPYITPSSEFGAQVLGNVISVDDKELAELDLYEGVAKRLYTRNTVLVHDIEDREQLPCFVYIATSVLHPQLITSGDWFNQ